MLPLIHKCLNYKYPQNFILKNPLSGSLIYSVFSFIFMLLYRPLGTHESQYFGYPVTMAIYMFASTMSVYILIHIIKSFSFFSGKNPWTFIKEVLSLLIVLAGTGITIYFMAFLLEVPANRWNLHTLLDSCKYGFLIGIIPLGFFTLVNYRHLFLVEVSENFGSENLKGETIPSIQGEKIQISSRLKKEELSFFPHQLIYAESDGNYVIFHLIDKDQHRSELIRNSMKEIDRQLSRFIYLTRIHRAFIVNVMKVKSKKGNAMGYMLKLFGTDTEIPVSRQKVKTFDQLVKQFK
jgi:hypothetical protein